MSASCTYKILAGLIATVLLLSACGPSQLPDSADSTISTAVAQTVQAQNTPDETISVTASPLPLTTPPSPVTSPTALATLTTVAGVGSELCTPSASFVGETIPDGTIVEPGTTFTKIWKVQNNGTCAWDASWQLVFYNGDLMDGLTAYQFPQETQPGQTVDVPVILKAPPATGSYKGEWMLKTPSGKLFGVGQYSVPLIVAIVVGSKTPENKKTESVFDVTAVTYKVDRRCAPANTFYTITAYVTTNGPLKTIFSTFQSDGHLEKNYQLNFTDATTKTLEWEWSQHKDSSPNPRWAQVILTSPTYKEFDKVVLPDLCPLG